MAQLVDICSKAGNLNFIPGTHTVEDEDGIPASCPLTPTCVPTCAHTCTHTRTCTLTRVCTSSKQKTRDWRGDSVVKSNFCSCNGHRFSSMNPMVVHNHLVPWDQMPSSDICGPQAHTCAAHTYLHTYIHTCMCACMHTYR